MRRSTPIALFSIIFLALGATAPVTPTVAQGPPTDVDISFTLADACEFPVLIELRGREKFIELPGGRFLLTSPGLTVNYTNLDDQSKQVTQSITGAFHITLLPDGGFEVVYTGRNAFGGPGDGLTLAVGWFTEVYDADGNLIQPLSGKGRLIDVCALLD